MRILFLTHYFPPEVNAPANRVFEHCSEWVTLGHEVHVITGVPSHPRGIPFSGYRSGWYRYEENHGIHVHRVWTSLAANQGKLKRIINYLSYVPTATLRSCLLGGFDIIIATSPQFFCAVAGWASAKLKRTPWLFELRDLWPHSIEAVGALRAGPVLRLLEKLELYLYRDSNAVVCVTKAFIEDLVHRGIDPEKLEYIPNGIVPGYWHKGDADSVRGALRLGPQGILVSYIGTVGMAHGIGTILESAKTLRNTHPHIHFAVIGAGAELDSLQKRAKDEGLTNLTFTGLVPHERIPDYMAATDISLVLLRKSDVFLKVLPSKMFESMAAGRPIILGVEGEAKEILKISGSGITIPPEDDKALSNAIIRLSKDVPLRAKMQEKGRVFVAQQFNRQTWARKYLNFIESRLSHPKHPA